MTTKEDTEKILQIAHIVENWFIDTGCFNMDGGRPDFDSVKKSICKDTINEIVSRALSTYNAFYDIVEIIDILHED